MKGTLLKITAIAVLLFTSTLVNAQMSKADCQVALEGYNLANSTKITMSSKDGNIKREFVMSYVTSFEFKFMESVLVIEYMNSQSETQVYYTYIPYSTIRYINSQKSKAYLDIVVND